jgi:glycosyltransferase involved in cell wall biosynthesis
MTGLLSGVVYSPYLERNKAQDMRRDAARQGGRVTDAIEGGLDVIDGAANTSGELPRVAYRDAKKPWLTEGLSVVTPAYNEGEAIDSVLRELTTALGGIAGAYEIIVVDDGSEDDTATIAGRFEEVTVLRHRSNRGYGAALKTGIRHASHDLICIVDADGTYPVDAAPDLVRRLVDGRFDMVVGARVGEEVEIPIIRRPAKWVLRQLANFVTDECIPDLNSGMRVFRRGIALRLFSILPNSFSFTTTITLAMLTNGYLVDYVPINYHARVGCSKISPARDTLHFIQLVGRIALYFAPLKIFLPASAAFFILAVGWALFSKLALGRLADVSTLVIAMSAFQVALIGMLAELVNRRLPNYYKE